MNGEANGDRHRGVWYYFTRYCCGTLVSITTGFGRSNTKGLGLVLGSATFGFCTMPITSFHGFPTHKRRYIIAPVAE